MKLAPELYYLALTAVLTALMWVPYMGARILTRGAGRTLGDPADPSASADPAWAQRARRAHANAVENFAVFAPLVIILALIGVSTPMTVLAAQTYLGARVVHYVVYAAGLPVVRTLAFVVGVGATLVIAAAVLGHT
ncbi:MAPEG family protein [Paraburkholderia sp. SARCC-3016]|uniref:MAPEG family protein n=1 Tax=Paraburkholderia sp. SARCC-3016 TaxID=3058611 RepID=UPI002808CE95|nr:MAPEG family protein [Paraburkholderia sp. SARCC-3016]MDQ7976058.1 MAPEG family protein [Paraburkholderia sp. SARCC-3016]